jgi:hypothetical protein
MTRLPIVHLRKAFSSTHNLMQEILPCAGYHISTPDAPVAAHLPIGHATATPWGSAWNRLSGREVSRHGQEK